jgi:N-glycosylase/DNA lyase
MEVPGIGQKVADCVLLYGCGRQEAVPADVWVRRLVAEAYYDGPNKQAPYAWIRRQVNERFAPWAGYAQHVLFHWRRSQGRSRPTMNATNAI